MLTITTQKHSHKRNTFVLLVDDEPRYEIHTSVFGKSLEFHSTYQDEQSFEEHFQEVEYQKTRNYAFKRLAMKNHSSFEMQQALEERYVSSQVIQKVIEECTQLGYINDLDWIQGFVASQKRKNLGAKMIRMKLLAKKVPLSLIEEMESSFSDGEEQQIHELLEKRFRNRNLEDFKEREKVIGALLRKGYDLELVREAVNSKKQGFNTLY